MDASESILPAIGPEHTRAICDEVGARLAFVPRPVTSDLPPRMAEVLGRLALLDHDAPSIVPSLEEMAIRQAAPPADSASSDASDD